MGLKGLSVTTYASTQLITLDEAKTFMRVDDTADDDLIEDLIDSCTRDIENYLRRSLITQTLKLTMDNFDGYGIDEHDLLGDGVHNMPRSYLYRADFIYLARPPIQSITSIKTYDTGNNESTFSSSNYTLDGETGRVFLNDGSVWPTDLRDINAVEVIYVGGYGDNASDVPSPIRRALRKHVNNVYNNRGSCDMCDHTKMELSSYKLQDYLGFV